MLTRESVERRRETALRMLKKYPEKIPVILLKDPVCKLDNIRSQKILVDHWLSIAQLLYILRTRISMKETEALYLFFKNDLLPSNTTMREAYDRYREMDDILYITYSCETTFG